MAKPINHMYSILIQRPPKDKFGIILVILAQTCDDIFNNKQKGANIFAANFIIIAEFCVELPCIHELCYRRK